MDVIVDPLGDQAAASHIDHFHPTFVRLFEENVLGLQVTVHYFSSLKKQQCLEHLYGDASNEVQRETGEIVFLEKVVETDMQQLEGDALG